MWGRKKDEVTRDLGLKEMRLVADLRVMHSKIDELNQMVERLREVHPESDIIEFADPVALQRDIAQIDKVYLWFVDVKTERDRLNGD